LTKIPLPLTLAWIVDLFTHWQFVWIPTAVAASVYLTWRSERLHHLLALAITVTVSSLSGIPSLDLANGNYAKTFGLVSTNLKLGQADLTSLKAWLDDTKPDVVVLLEVTEQAAEEIDHWHEYKTRQFLPAATPFGIGVLARDNARVKWQEHNGIPYAEVNSVQNNKKLVLYGIHPMPPITPEDHQSRNQLIRSLNEIAKDTPVIVAGDLNTSPWSSALNINNLYRVTDLNPTWLGVLPIDIVLASKHWKKISSAIGPDIGSDHRAVFAELILNEP
jgi:endonuclease/exonuclease/phosphatase (EEP) superfamily protein YafD